MADVDCEQALEHTNEIELTTTSRPAGRRLYLWTVIVSDDPDRMAAQGLVRLALLDGILDQASGSPTSPREAEPS
jgi:hypothetical protein